MAKTKIQWTDETDNVFVVKGDDGEPNGWYCEKVSEGCKNCYAERLNGTSFYGGNGMAYTRPSKWQDLPELMIRYDILEGWVRKRVPKRRFVNSMTDTFGEFIPDEWLDELFAYMSLAPTQTFQVLTKRAKRMSEYFNAPGVDVRVEQQMELICGAHGWCSPDLEWPLPNVWLGVSVENQARADERIPHLLQTPATVRFLSVEPLLGPVDLGRWLFTGGRVGSPLEGEEYDTWPAYLLDWIIVGGESGSNARPMHPDWVRSIRIQCQEVGLPFFFKQWGEWLPAYPINGEWGCRAQNGEFIPLDTKYPGQNLNDPFFYPVFKVGKHRAGRLLDGREWNEFPGVSDSGDGGRAHSANLRTA